MIIFRNVDYNGFISESANKDIVVWGAGNTLNDFLFNHKRDGRVLLLDKIVSVLDNNPLKIGRQVCINKKIIKVESLENYLGKGKSFNNCVVILMLANCYLISVIKQLDTIREMDGLVCYYGLSALNWGKELFPSVPSNPCLPKPKLDHKIPKTIHYCWFGGNPFPNSAKDCIESWKKYCPDYELRLWNEDNYDMSKTPTYVRQAYDAKKYAFVSDFARLDIVNKYGGLYLDVDVELVKSIDHLLCYKAFFGFLPWATINTGLGFGSIANNRALSEMMLMYELFDFILPDGSHHTVDCPRYATEYFRRNGVYVNNSLQMVDDTLFLPSAFMSPLEAVTGYDGARYLSLHALGNETISIHKCDSSWFSSENLDTFTELKSEYALINDRLRLDWERSIGRNG